MTCRFHIGLFLSSCECQNKKHSTHHSGKAFTLIELLVVISVIALLLGILIPILGRVRRQARSVVCQSNLRQWGLAFWQYRADNRNRMPLGRYFVPVSDWDPTEWRTPSWLTVIQPYCSNFDGIILCPMAVKRNLGTIVPDDPRWAYSGSTFVAWGPVPNLAAKGGSRYGSYGTNDRVFKYPQKRWNPYLWEMTDRDKNAARIPVLLDCIEPWASAVTDPHDHLFHLHSPPDRDGIPHAEYYLFTNHIQDFCINRHDGGINSLFLDGHVRKVGLKELWTLKWGPNSSAAGRWTQAGGVQREDWPEWMREFKDY